MTRALVRTFAEMFRSLRVRNYRLFATGQAVSLTGTWMQLTAQDWLVLELSGNSSAALGLVTALQFTPMLLLTLWAGAIVDRIDRRWLLFGVLASMMVLAVAMGALVLTGAAQLWHVYVFALLLGSAQAFDMPARQAFVAQLVGRPDLPNAVALNSAVFNVARISGPAAAGLLIAWVGTGAAFAVNAVSFLAVLTSLVRMRPADMYREPKAVVPDGEEPVGGRVVDGLRYVARRPDLLLVVAIVSVVGTLGMNFVITLPLLAKAEFHVGPASFGLLMTSFSVGALAGALLGSRRRTRPSATALLTFAALFGLLEVAVGLAPTFLTAALVLLPTGALLIGHNNAANARTQLGTDPALRGRVMALYMLVFLGGTPLGALLVGWVGEWYGPRAGLALGGVSCLVAAGVLALVRARRRGPHDRHAVPSPDRNVERLVAGSTSA